MKTGLLRFYKTYFLLVTLAVAVVIVKLNFFEKKSYTFSHDQLGFFIGDVSFFNNLSYDEAEDKMIALFPDKLQPKVQKVIRPVLSICEKHQVDPFWVLSVLWTESHFKHESISRKGAKGLMQMMPETFEATLAEMKAQGIELESEKETKELKEKYQAELKKFGPNKFRAKLNNLEVGIYYLKGLLAKFRGNHYYATVAYNMGPTWTSSQLKNNKPVAVKNKYLEKVLKAYYHITRTLASYPHVAYEPRR